MKLNLFIYLMYPQYLKYTIYDYVNTNNTLIQVLSLKKTV